jgi:hypothetical protein
MSFEEEKDTLDNLILELSLASCLPVANGGKKLVEATSAANSFGNHVKLMPPSELRQLSNGIGPLLTLLHTNLDNPVAAKAAYSLRNLLQSRTCMKEFLELDGLVVISKIFQQFISGKKVDLITQSNMRTIVEHCAVCFREIARFYPHLVVKAGALRYIVIILKYGDVALRTIASAILAVISLDLELCKLMFTNGCVKPLINEANSEDSNEACVLASLGCIVQLCR